MEKKLYDISSKLGAFFNKCSPQVKENSLQWYLAGSLATMITGDALELCEVNLDENNNIISYGKIVTLSDMQKTMIQTFGRQLGSDIDVINVNGNMFRGASKDRKPSINRIKENIPEVLELIPAFGYVGGTAYIDNLDYEQILNCHHVTLVNTTNGPIFITSVPEQLAYKLRDLLIIHNEYRNNNVYALKHYQKDIRDILTMIYGYKNLYTKEEFVERISASLNFNLNPEIISEVIGYIKKNVDNSVQINEITDFLEYILINKYNHENKSNKNK